MNQFPVVIRPRFSIFQRFQRFYFLLVARFNQSSYPDYFYALKFVFLALFNFKNFFQFTAVCVGSIFYDFRLFLTNLVLISSVVFCGLFLFRLVF